ncbi:MAG: hypothetical protein IPL13_12210 [Saprospiraceae bacterium]|nr:hypothetical protein [Candidatus Brachybacter algidus]
MNGIFPQLKVGLNRYTTPCSNCLMPTEGAAYGTGTINATHEWTASNGWTDYYDCNTKN